MKLKWKKTENYLEAKTENFVFKQKLAMFDLDSTLITPKIGKNGQGKGFPIDENDWKFMYDTTKKYLKKFIENDYCVIIISNQGGMSLGKQTFEVWSKKVNQICEKLNIDIYIFCSVAHNKYRKPLPTWFYEFIPQNIQDNIDRQMSFYCGDACGRKGDFSDTDYKFALNCMVKFKTPEELFNNEYEKIPKIIYPNIFSKSLFENYEFEPLNEKEMIIMIGYQGSGKSYISSQIEKNNRYVVINMDTIKSKDKCIKMTEELLKENKSVVIDQTNPDKTTRKIWIDLAKKYSYKIRAIQMTTSFELSKHNNYYRYLMFGTKLIPTIAYNIYKSKFENPNVKEGFNEIIKTHCARPMNPMYSLFLY